MARLSMRLTARHTSSVKSAINTRFKRGLAMVRKRRWNWGIRKGSDISNELYNRPLGGGRRALETGSTHFTDKLRFIPDFRVT